MGEPKLSIVISCYNYESYVAQAIESVMSQKIEDCELLVVDDGSTDDSWDIIKASGAPAVRIANGGSLEACRYGFKKTKAPFVMFLDADDLLKPGSIMTILSKLDSDVSKLQFSLTRVDAAGAVLKNSAICFKDYRLKEKLISRIIRGGTYRSPPTSGNVFRRDLCELLFDVDYDDAVDGVILLAAPFFGDVVSVSEELGCYRVHGRNDSDLKGGAKKELFARDISRIGNRLHHLENILQNIGCSLRLPDPERIYPVIERRFYYQIASGNGHQLSLLPNLLISHLGNDMPLHRKCAIFLYFLLMAAVPNKYARVLMSYRLQPGLRSASTLLKRLRSFFVR